MMGASGLRAATQIAILSTPTTSPRAWPAHYEVHYSGNMTASRRRVAHECILDLRPLKETTGDAASAPRTWPSA